MVFFIVPSPMKLPVEKPEQGLIDAIKDMNTPDVDDWESVANGIFMIGRLASYHPTVLVPRFQEVIRLLSKNVSLFGIKCCGVAANACCVIFLALCVRETDTISLLFCQTLL